MKQVIQNDNSPQIPIYGLLKIEHYFRRITRLAQTTHTHLHIAA